DAAGHFERAQLIVRQVKPAAFSGSLVISAKGGVTAFTNEKPTKGEKAALPYTIADASKIPAKGDRTLWAEGKAPSVDMLDAGFIHRVLSPLAGILLASAIVYGSAAFSPLV